MEGSRSRRRHADETEDERRERKRLKREKKRKRHDEEQDQAHAELDDRGDQEEEDEERALAAAERRPRRAYDDEDDAGLPFVWNKKNSMLRRRGVRLTAADEERRRVEAVAELERAKVAREERQAKRDEVEASRAEEARVREQQMNEDWDRKEESFHGHQHFLRQAIRLRENRASLADALARNVRLDLLELAPEKLSPCEVVNGMLAGLSHAALVELHDAVQLELDFIPDFSCDDDTAVFTRALRLEWWTSLAAFVADILAWAAVEDMPSGSDAPQQQPRRRVHPSVQQDLEEMLNGKSREELETMEAEIAPNLEVTHRSAADADDEFADVEFWQAALGRIRRGIAEARVAALNKILMDERAAMLAAMPDEPEESKVGRYGADTGDLGEGPVDMGEEAMVRAEEAKGMREDEERFADLDMSVAGRTYGWNDKYRPRRPRFFNRVQTGYDWNKYNRTHYDHDNPPPKTVQGYKFNIFYPDLIDRSSAPTFVVRTTENPEVCILTFKAGPPYEDLAFKVVNRPWEHSHRRGFRCVFDRGVLQLWFNFRRLRYRR